MDRHTPEQRSYNMSNVKGKNTTPEMVVRTLLWHNGYRYRLHRKDLPGKPDIVFPGKKKVIFVHGCFWHKHDCKHFTWPKSNVDFWKKKILANLERDKKNIEALTNADWESLSVWECETKMSHREELLRKLTDFLR